LHSLGFSKIELGEGTQSQKATAKPIS